MPRSYAHLSSWGFVTGGKCLYNENESRGRNRAKEQMTVMKWCDRGKKKRGRIPSLNYMYKCVLSGQCIWRQR